MKIEFNHVDKVYGLSYAIRDISFVVNPGEFIFVMGPSGAGKSTILKLILNQIKPTSGDILFDDIDVNSKSKVKIEHIRRKIGVIFQDYQLIPDKNIEENIALALDIVNYPKSQIMSKIEEVIKKVSLQHRRLLFPSQLSGGELQRAALARALSIDPEIILADEPTGNLDSENSWNLLKLLKKINENYHTSIIMTTHNREIVDSLGKRVIYLKQGQIEKDNHGITK